LRIGETAARYGDQRARRERGLLIEAGGVDDRAGGKGGRIGARLEAAGHLHASAQAGAGEAGFHGEHDLRLGRIEGEPGPGPAAVLQGGQRKGRIAVREGGDYRAVGERIAAVIDYPKLDGSRPGGCDGEAIGKRGE